MSNTLLSGLAHFAIVQAILLPDADDGVTADVKPNNPNIFKRYSTSSYGTQWFRSGGGSSS